MCAYQFSTNDLDIQPVDKNSPIPYYQQIRLDLLMLLHSEKINPGDMLPPEYELAQAFEVSRQTIRHAIGLIEADGLVDRTPGRGTTVLNKQNRLEGFLDQSFSQQMIAMGLKPHSKVLRKRKIKIDQKAPRLLQKKEGCDALELIRLRLISEMPIGIEYSFTVMDQCPNLDTFNYEEESLYNILLKKYKIPISKVNQTVSAVLADDWYANVLEVEDKTPLLVVETTSYLRNGHPLETSTGFYRADRYEFSISQDY